MLSASVVRAAPDNLRANQMRAVVLCGQDDSWEAGPRSAAELREAATHYERAAALTSAPALKANFAGNAKVCRNMEYDAAIAACHQHLQLGSQDPVRAVFWAWVEVIKLAPERPTAYYNLGAALANLGLAREAAGRFLEAKKRCLVDSVPWAIATAWAFNMLTQVVRDEVDDPEWWNDEGLKALSARVVWAAPDDEVANGMRARVLSRREDAWEAGPRSSAQSVLELDEAAFHFDRAAELSSAPGGQGFEVEYAGNVVWCRRQAEKMCHAWVSEVYEV